MRRDGNGYRRYNHRALEQARTVLRLRRVGLSLPEVTAAMAPAKAAARAVVRAKIAALEEEIARRQRCRHTAECRHRYLDDCPECAAFVRED
ncbi:MerR family transcriptional regulator [Streptomyces albidoflavus]|uniref:MerR family transcriptional regulator n=1 Tax=Streptomyces albidoflavus TaxID=1886 RepID=UPI0033A63296